MAMGARKSVNAPQVLLPAVCICTGALALTGDVRLGQLLFGDGMDLLLHDTWFVERPGWLVALVSGALLFAAAAFAWMFRPTSPSAPAAVLCWLQVVMAGTGAWTLLNPLSVAGFWGLQRPYDHAELSPVLGTVLMAGFGLFGFGCLLLLAILFLSARKTK